ncbi:MAG: hypothetical protein PPP58_04760 [Natronomonas sp.]
MPANQNRLSRLYVSRIDPNGTETAAGGYWLIVFATLLALSGIALFLWGSTYTRGEPLYWAFRQAGIVLAAGGLPLVLLGITLRLPLQPAAAVLGGVGTLVCFAAVVWFVGLYPEDWTFAGPQPVMLAYSAGVLLLAVGLTGVPIVTKPGTSDTNRRITERPWYELREDDGEWRWLLHSNDGTVIAESARRFPTPAGARGAIIRMSTGASGAGVELTTEEEA